MCGVRCGSAVCVCVSNEGNERSVWWCNEVCGVNVKRVM